MKKILILMLFGFYNLISYSQTAPVEYELRYNSSTGLYEARAHVISGNLNGGPPVFRILSPSKFTVVFPATSVGNTVITPTSVAAPGSVWTNSGTNVYAPSITPNLDYRLFETGGGGTFASFAAGDDILLFTFSLVEGCVDGVRVFNNDTDPDSAQPGMGGADLTNVLQTTPSTDQYSGNRNEDFFFVQTNPGNWNDASTWLNSRIPTPYSNVRITHSGVSTILASDQDYVVDNLELLDADSELIVESGRTLGITRDVTNAGEFSGDGLVELIGTCGAQDLIGTGAYNKLIADNLDGVNVTESTVINGYLNVDNGIFTTNDATTFPCDFDTATGPAPFTRHAVGQIGPITGTGAISGDVTVEQCFPGRRAFRLVSASTNGNTIHNEWQENPETDLTTDPPQYGYKHNPKPGYGTHITGVKPDPTENALGQQNLDQVNGLDWQPSGNASMFSFSNDASQSWDRVLDTETPTLSAGDAYLMMIRGSRAVNLESNASPTSDTKLESTGTIALTSGVPVSPNIGNNDFALIGNPYHAVVNLSLVDLLGSGYTNNIYVYDPNIGGSANVNPDSNTLGGRGGYVMVNATTGAPSVITGLEVNATDATNQLQPYQAFFVQAASTGIPGTITFNEGDKNVSGTQSDVFSNPEQSRIFVTLFDKVSLDNLSTPDDGLVINFSLESSNAVDDNDAPKFFNQDEVIARNENGSLISFENRAMPVEEDVLNLYIDQYRAVEYVLEVGVEYITEQTAYLIDNYTETELALENNMSNLYNFTVDPSNPESIATDRFKIVFQSTTFSTNDFDLQGISVYPNPVKDIVTIDLSQFTGEAKQLQVFDITGKLINQKDISNGDNQFNINMTEFASGVYILKIETANGQFQSKLIKE